MSPLFKVLAIYYAIINIVLIILMGVDKVKAKRNEWRIKEATLFSTALLGRRYRRFYRNEAFSP